jgi:hypothetical protein
MPTTELPAEPCRLEKCRSSRAGVKTANRLEFSVLAGSAAGADGFSVRAGHSNLQDYKPLTINDKILVKHSKP